MKYISATKIMLSKETLGTLTDSIRVTNKIRMSASLLLFNIVQKY